MSMRDDRVLSLLYSPHMTSVDNEAGRASGHADVPLSMLGREQAAELGRFYASEVLDVVFHSDLQRATATAEIAFAGRGLQLVPDRRLRECDYGDLTQSPASEIDGEFITHLTEPFPHGESVAMAACGVGDFLADAVRDYAGKTVVVIGHRVTKYGLVYWSGSTSLEEIVRAPWEWRDIPIWRFQIDGHDFELRRRNRQLACLTTGR
jgi:broad specificity phosphatase PhoE